MITHQSMGNLTLFYRDGIGIGRFDHETKLFDFTGVKEEEVRQILFQVDEIESERYMRS